MLSARKFGRTSIFQSMVLGFAILAYVGLGDSVWAQSQPISPSTNDVDLSNDVEVAEEAGQVVEFEPALPGSPVYGGSLWERPNFTGDWFGSRSLLAAGGIKFTGDLTNYHQGVVNGGRNQHFKFGGHSDYVFDFDMEKVAGAKGMFIRVRGETQYGEFVNRDTGAILATNTSGLFPTAGEQATALTEFTITQFLSETFGVFAGKLQTMDGDKNDFASGRGKTQFMNVAFVANPGLFRTVPYSSYGFGFVVLGEEQEPLLTVTAIDPIDRSTELNLDKVFEEGVTLSAEGRVRTDFFGMKGHQLLGVAWSNRDVALLSSGARLLLPNFATPTSNESWAMYWNFDQYLFVDPCDQSKGWGLFGRATIADAATNPLEWFLSFGVGGNSRIAGRSNDTFGAGVYYAGTSSELPGLLLGNDGQGAELFYNFQVTPSFHLTTDLQFVDPSLGLVDDSFLFGLRGKLDF